MRPAQVLRQIELLRIDTVEYEHVLGLRLNVWTSIVLFCLAAVYFVIVGRKRPGREVEVYTEKRLARDRAAAEDAPGDALTPADTPASGPVLEATPEPDPVERGPEAGT